LKRGKGRTPPSAVNSKFLSHGNLEPAKPKHGMNQFKLHRVLKSTGSLYFHRDPTASHYLKVALAGVFGKINIISP
jgi:hypothetical protein